MKALIACLALAGCVTDASPRAPPDRVAGCWANRSVGAVLMRWTPDSDHAGAMVGARTVLGISDQRSEAFTLEPEGDGWKICRQGEASQCWAVAQGDGGSLEGGRAFIDATGDSLRIAVVGDGPERVIFQGRRDRCR